MVLVPATRWETKCWPAERFGEVARRFRKMKECDRCWWVVAMMWRRGSGRRAWRGAAFNACGRTTLRQLAALISGARIVITGDSTPMHLAAALGRPLVALFGPTNPRRTGPYGRMADVVRLELDCSPCYLKRLSECPHEHACMEQLDVESVVAAAVRRLMPSEAVGAR